MRRLQEPERWKALAAEKTIGERFRAYGQELFSDARWTRNALVGLLLASSGIIGLWAIGFFSIDFIQAIIRPRLEAEGLSKDDVTFNVGIWASVTSVVLNVGAFFGIYAFSRATTRLGRRPAFAISFVLALGSTALVFGLLNSFAEIFWMIPLMGFCQLALFGGYAIYFPELFPTRLRSTGISFCYNGARFVAATGPFIQGRLQESFLSLAGGDAIKGFRWAGLTMCSIFLVGLLVLPFAPETRGQPLPE
jgi:MFS family permease